MYANKSRRAVSLVASAVLITSLAAAAFAAPAVAAPSEQQVAAKQARMEARAEAGAAREAAKQVRAEARAQAKADREAATLARAEARAARKAAKQAATTTVTVCHKPGTPAEGTLEISGSALEAHLAHGDIEGACDSMTPESQTTTTCPEPGDLDTEMAPDDGSSEDETVVCDEPQQSPVSIDAPESIDSPEVLELHGAVDGLEADEPVFAWSSTCLTDEQMIDPTVVTSEPGAAVLVIQGGVLPPGTTCDFTLTVTDEATGVVGSATVTVEVMALP